MEKIRQALIRANSFTNEGYRYLVKYYSRKEGLLYFTLIHSNRNRITISVRSNHLTVSKNGKIIQEE